MSRIRPIFNIVPYHGILFSALHGLIGVQRLRLIPFVPISKVIEFALTLFGALMAPDLRTASMVCVSRHSTPFSPIRLRQRVRQDGSMGGRCRKNVSPVKC